MLMQGQGAGDSACLHPMLMHDADKVQRGSGALQCHIGVNSVCTVGKYSRA